MASRKPRGRKKRLVRLSSSAKPAPRWADIKTFGLKHSITRSIKRRRDRHWRRSSTKE